MASALISKPVLAANPAANCNAYIVGLLDELRQKIDALPIVPGQATVAVDTDAVYHLRGVSTELSGAIRNQLKWA
jgi:hypothetical protein